jgi:hypothetical protein
LYESVQAEFCQKSSFLFTGLFGDRYGDSVEVLKIFVRLLDRVLFGLAAAGGLVTIVPGFTPEFYLNFDNIGP